MSKNKVSVFYRPNNFKNEWGITAQVDHKYVDFVFAEGGKPYYTYRLQQYRTKGDMDDYVVIPLRPVSYLLVELANNDFQCLPNAFHVEPYRTKIRNACLGILGLPEVKPPKKLPTILQRLMLKTRRKKKPKGLDPNTPPKTAA